MTTADNMNSLDYEPDSDSIPLTPQVPIITEPIIDTWVNLPLGYRTSATPVVSYKAVNGNGYIGVDGTGISFIQTKDDTDNVHIYNRGVVDTLYARNGKHTINKGGCVVTLDAAGTAIVDVYGYVNRLIAQDSAQIIIHEDAYINYMEIHTGAYARIHKHASVSDLTIKAGGRALIDTEAKLNNIYEETGSKLGHILSEPDTAPKYKVVITASNRKDLVDIAQMLTDQYRAGGCYIIDNLTLDRIHHCQLDDYSISFCCEYTNLDYQQYNKKLEPTFKQTLYKQLSKLCYKDSIELILYIDGEEYEPQT